MVYFPQYDDKIMEAVFDKFLEKPPNFYLQRDDTTAYYVDTIINHVKHVFGVPIEDNIIRWHIALLFDEFVLNQHIVSAVFGNMELPKPMCAYYLNERGQRLYKRLKNLP